MTIVQQFFCSPFKFEIAKLECCFNRIVRRFLNLSLSRSDFYNSLLLISRFKLMTLRLRFFQRCTKFVFRVFNRANVSSIMLRVIKCTRAVRHPYMQPAFSSRFGEHSFSNISVKLLNKFVNNFLTPSNVTTPSLQETIFSKFLNDNLTFYFNFFDNFF